ncbi:MAG: type II toxin-antitoxin system RelE/ParE family toxin [Neisseria sp.]|nr:type II toxin-antitoxin system RelE/ParE family toxin [Neisseria sp.]
MRIFKFKHVAKFAAKQGITDSDLVEAVARAENGLVDADLGGGVIKQRIARQGQGKRGGYRSIILFKREDKAFFAHVFAKNEQENITVQELIYFKSLAAETQALSNERLDYLKSIHELTELAS